MAVIERRTFYGKVGKAEELVEACWQFFDALSQAGLSTGMRILTDYQSGRTDRVVCEMEAETLGALESDMEALMSMADVIEARRALESRLAELITHAEVEHWQAR